MPTLIYADGFEHRSTSLNDFSAADAEGLWDAIAGVPTINTTNQRTGNACLECSPAGALLNANKNVPGADPTISVVSFYIRFTTLPATDAALFRFGVAAGTRGGLFFRSASGTFNVSAGNAPDTAKDVGGTVSAATWYRVDAKFDVSTGTTTLDIAIDGGTGVQDTLAQAATTVTGWFFGLDTGTPTYTAQYDDFVASNTAGDYPLGAHRVLPLQVNGDGTHNTGGAGNFDKVGGVDITDATTDAWLEIDDWITDADDGQTTGILQLLIGSTLYTEHTFGDTTESTIWAAMGTMASGVSSATAHTATYRIVDSGGTTVLDLFTGDVSISVATHYRNRLLAANPTQATVNGYKFRFGFSTDATPDPQVTAVMLQIAVPGDPPAAATSLIFDPGMKPALIVR